MSTKFPEITVTTITPASYDKEDPRLIQVVREVRAWLERELLVPSLPTQSAYSNDDALVTRNLERWETE